MSVSTPWNSASPASVARKNKTSVISDEGVTLETLDKTKFKIVTCTEDGGAYIKDHAYLFTTAGDDAIDLTALADHTHAGDSGDGGSLNDVYFHNPQVIDLLLIKNTDLTQDAWITTTTGTGTIEDTNDSGARVIRLRTNGTSGSSATIQYPAGLNIDLTQPSAFALSGKFETASSLALHLGVNCDDITASDSNARQYASTVCTVTNSNWWVRTANGTSNSASDTGIAISTSTTSHRLRHTPTGTPSVELEIDAASSFTKTTDIPVDGTAGGDDIIKISLKNSTAADRPFRFRGCRLSYVTSDTWAYD